VPGDRTDVTPMTTHVSQQPVPSFRAVRTTSRVLLVDDQPIVAEAMRRLMVDEPDIAFCHCVDPEQAVVAARDIAATVILQDLVMPGVDGFELLRRYRADIALRHVPVIVLSSREDPRDKSRAFERGASDYLVKIPDRIELIARIRAQSRAYLAQIELQQAYERLETLKHELETRNAELAMLSSIDGLTGIANRRTFDAALDREWRRAAREQSDLSLMLLDVDFFKRYNDYYGHQAGDECLRTIARAIATTLRRPADLAARYGGEEFAALLPGTSLDGAQHVAQAVSEAVAALGLPHARSDVACHVTLSIGIAAAVPAPSAGSESLVRHADTALYESKQAGRNRSTVKRVESAIA